MSLRSEREKNNITQAELAKLTKLNVQVLRHYEQGVRDINGTKLKVLLSLCLALNCKLEDIITDSKTLDLLERY